MELLHQTLPFLKEAGLIPPGPPVWEALNPLFLPFLTFCTCMMHIHTQYGIDGEKNTRSYDAIKNQGKTNQGSIPRLSVIGLNRALSPRCVSLLYVWPQQGERLHRAAARAPLERTDHHHLSVRLTVTQPSDMRTGFIFCCVISSALQQPHCLHFHILK